MHVHNLPGRSASSQGIGHEGTAYHFQNDRRGRTPIGSAESDHSAHGKFSGRRAPGVCCYDKEARVWTHIWEQKSEERRAAAVPNFLKSAARLPEQSTVGTCGDRQCVSQPSPPPAPTSSPGTRHILASPDKGEQERDLLQAQRRGAQGAKTSQGRGRPSLFPELLNGVSGGRWDCDAGPGGGSPWPVPCTASRACGPQTSLPRWPSPGVLRGLALSPQRPSLFGNF